MTKARIAIYTAIFLAFSLIGIALAYQFRYRILSPVSSPTVRTPAPVSAQQNLLVIHMMI
jgi:hypothetical protein